MAKRRKKQKKIATKRARQKTQRPAARLQTARQAMQSSNFPRAIELSTAALAAAKDANTIINARRVMAEAHFRAAAKSINPEQRLYHLDAALAVVAEESSLKREKLHYHRGVTLLRLGRAQDALAEFDTVAAQQPDRPGLNVMHQLARILTAQPWRSQGLSAVEADWLHLVDSLVRGADPKALTAQLPAMNIPNELRDLWRLLLQMVASPSSAAVTRMRAAVEQAAPLVSSPILPYYLGVTNLRKGDADEARVAWHQAAEEGLTTDWFIQNRAALARVQAVELAQAEQWQAVLDLAQSDRLTDYNDDVLTETIGLAHFHLGYAAATAKDWVTAVLHLRTANDLIGNRRLFQNLALAEEEAGEWIDAAEAWREMARRRPRKQDHPDYLSDAQVAAIWRRAATDYMEEYWAEEAIACMKNAVKYAPDDVDLRLRLVDIYVYDDRTEVAMNELDRVLEIDPEHVEALLRLAALRERTWGGDPTPLWRRILAVDPTNKDARDALALHYVDEAGTTGSRGLWGRLRKHTEKEKIAHLQEGLEAVPDHPALLISLGLLYVDINKYKEARTYLLAAWAAEPHDVNVVGTAMHELLHANGGDIVKEKLPEARAIPGLLPPFWIDQGEQAFTCDLGEEWMMLFWDEAVSLAEAGRGEDSKAYVLLRIFDIMFDPDDPSAVEPLVARIEAEVPNSGAVEYVQGARLLSEADVPNIRSKVVRLARKAQQRARKANEPGVEKLAVKAESIATGKVNRLLDMMDRDGLLDILAGMDKEELDDFRSSFF